MKRAELVDNVIEIEKHYVRMMKLKIIVGRKIGNVFTMYAPQAVRPKQEKIEFWEKFEDKIE